MIKRISLVCGTAWGAAMIAACAMQTASNSSEEWQQVNGSTDETGFSALHQISSTNVGRLGLAWFVDLPGETSLQGSPIEVGGILYFTGSYSTVYAVDPVDGRLIWKFEPKTWEHNPGKMNFNFSVNRGAAYADGRIFSAALDGRLFALNAKSGELIWSTETTDPKNGQTITGAPRVFNGKVIIGQGGADFGMRGYVSAYDQRTGAQVWRFYVVPASPEANQGDPAMEAAAQTWSGEFWKRTGGGGGPWDAMTFDAKLNRVYVGTGNAAPWDSEARSPGGGDNLYTASIVALDADTGRYVWHYQVNPRDGWDFDTTAQMTLTTLNIDGQQRDVLMQAPKNGFFYVLDRHTGKVISAEKLGKVNWADHIDLATGRPVENPGVRYDNGPSIVYPSSSGMHTFVRMAYSAATGLVYVPTLQVGTRLHRGAPDAADFSVLGLNVSSVEDQPGDGRGSLVAWDPVAQKARWRVQLDTLWNGGALATAGSVVFQGAGDGWFSAYDARSGARLWQQNLGMGINASPVTYAVRGKQYVSILAGYGGSAGVLSDIMNVGWKYSGPRRLYTFVLDGKSAMPPSPAPSLKVNVQDDPSEVLDPAQIAMGHAIFIACAACHGRNAISVGGPAPDLRESRVPLSREAFSAVVHDGALIQRGMPAFAFFTPPQIEAIRQYVRSTARLQLAKQ